MARKRTDDDDVFDARGCLKDGKTLHVGLRMRDGVADDGLTDLHRTIRDATAPAHVVDGLGGTARLHQPGPRYARPGDQGTADAAVAVTRRMADEARREWITEMCDAWRKPPPTPVEVPRSEFECRPTKRQDGRDAAYYEMVNELTNAWKRPAR